MIQGTILPGHKFNAHIHWSKRDDGPMNIIGREFPPSLSGPSGDTERWANRASFLSKIGFTKPTQTAIPKLKHGTDIKYVTEHNTYMEDLIGDGIITDRAKFTLTMTFADCPSVVLFDGTSGALCLLHAGWRGIADGIVEKGLGTMLSFGGQKHRIMAFIGPGVRKCCYELDPDTASKVDGVEYYGHVNVDLQGIIGMRLVANGLPAENISGNDDCTCCAVDKKSQKPLYFSYRREKSLDPLNAGMLVASFY